MKNSGKAKFKRTQIDLLLNRIILGVRKYSFGFFPNNKLFDLDFLFLINYVCNYDNL